MPAEFERLPEFGIGLTDICKVSYGSDAEVGVDEFDLGGLQEKIAAAEPGCLAFNGKNAARGALERDVAYGPQDEQIGGASIRVRRSVRVAPAGFGRSSRGSSSPWPAGPKPTGSKRTRPAARRASAR